MMLEILAQTTVNTPLPIEMVFTDGNMLLSQRDSLIVITKLYKDGYVDKVNTTGIDYYYITFEGMVCIINGGYTSILSDRMSQKKIETLNRNLLTAGSWIAGIGTLLLFFVEIWKICDSY